MLKKGIFITLEGGEGVGKTTNASYICEWMEGRNIPFIATREPGGTELSETIRGLLLDKKWQGEMTSLTELLLVFAARAQHLEQVIKPALDAGKWVFCDRFTDATYAYQGGGRGFDEAAIQTLETFVQHSLQPDVTLLLDLPVHIGMQRATARADLDRFESENIDFFDRVRGAYLERAAQNPQRFRCIDASQSLDDVQHELGLYLEALL